MLTLAQYHGSDAVVSRSLTSEYRYQSLSVFFSIVPPWKAFQKVGVSNFYLVLGQSQDVGYTTEVIQVSKQAHFHS